MRPAGDWRAGRTRSPRATRAPARTPGARSLHSRLGNPAARQPIPRALVARRAALRPAVGEEKAIRGRVLSGAGAADRHEQSLAPEHSALVHSVWERPRAVERD